MEDKLDISDYFDEFQNALSECINSKRNKGSLLSAIKLIKEIKKDNKIILIGNGGSAAIAEHMAIDFTKNAKLRAVTISGSPQLTTFANDYGYEHIYSKGIEAYATKGDVLIAISSGGTSVNILNAVDSAKKIGCKVITFSGFNPNNPLTKKGHINIHVNSQAYGYVELIHNLMIHYLNDSLIGSAVYKFR